MSLPLKVFLNGAHGLNGQEIQHGQGKKDVVSFKVGEMKAYAFVSSSID